MLKKKSQKKIFEAIHSKNLEKIRTESEKNSIRSNNNYYMPGKTLNFKEKFNFIENFYQNQSSSFMKARADSFKNNTQRKIRKKSLRELIKNPSVIKERKKIKKFNQLNLNSKLSNTKNFDKKCLEIFKIKHLVQRRSKMMEEFNKKLMEKLKKKEEIKDSKLLIREYIEEKRKKEEENEDVNKHHFTIEERPDFELVKKEAAHRDKWLDYSNNPKTTIELMNRIKDKQFLDLFLEKIKYLEGKRVNDLIKMKRSYVPPKDKRDSKRF